MKGLLRANLKHHGRRYVATGVAVAIATAFGLLALALGNGLGTSTRNAFISQYAGTDVIVQRADDASEDGLEDFHEVEAQIKQVPGVVAVSSALAAFVQGHFDGVSSGGFLGTYVPEFDDVQFSEGRAPVDGQVAVKRSVAEALNVHVGDKIEVGEAGGDARSNLEVSGIFGSEGIGTIASSDFFVTDKQFGQITDPYVEEIHVAGEGDLNAEERVALAQAVTSALANDSLQARTQDQVLDEELARVNADETAMNMLVGIFPLIAAIVAVIVVATTFQVIIQQRTRELAMLRCLGATQKQVTRMLLGESLVVGAVSSLIGVVVGALLGAVLVSALGVIPGFGAALAATSLPSVIGVFLFGTLVTVLAGARPAAKIGKLSPLEALGSSEVPLAKRTTGWWIRLVVGLVLACGGTVGLVYFSSQSTTQSFLFAILSGVVCLVGAILALTSAFAWLVSGLGWVGKRSVIGRMARGNVLRNPGRTAATGVSVVIGVALIVMMLVGSASLRSTLDRTLDAQMPIDMTVSNLNGELTEADLKSISELPGVAEAQMQRAIIWSGQDEPPVTLDGQDITLTDMNAFANVARSELPVPADGELFVSEEWAGKTQGELCVNGSCQNVTLVPQTFLPWTASANLKWLESIAGDSLTNWMIVIQLSDLSNQASVSADIQRMNTDYMVDGAALMRAQYEQVLGIIVMIVVALLLVSVLVALVGVSNTLSLSVAERTRENGLLRALGMTKRQIARQLSVESILIGVTGAIVGTALGVFFGICGMRSFPMDLSHLDIVINWWQLVAVILIAVFASVVAAWLPGRAASRVSPVEALAAD